MKKRIQLLLGATLIVFMGLGQAFGQSFKTITVDGSLTDWTYADDGDFARGGQNTNWYFAWDDTYFYFAVERVNSSTFGDGDAATIFLDINGGLTSSSGKGTTTGSEYQGVTATLPVNVDFAIRLERNYKQMNRWDDGSSAWSSNLSTTNFSDSNNGDTRTIREARIPWTEINENGSKPNSISIISYLSYNTGVFGSFPEGNETQNGNGGTKTFSNFVGYLPLNESIDSNSLRDSLNHYLIVDGTEGWRMLSTPTSNNTYDDLLGDIWTQGIGTGADATTGTANVQSYDTGSDTFSGVSNLNATMSSGVGFITFVYSDDDYTNSGADAGFPKTLSLSGTENSGDVSPTLNTEGDAFTLVGNPYASTIDWDLLTRSDVTGTVYVYDNADSGYDTWNGTTGDLTDGLITTYQGFWVQNTSGSPTPSLTIQEADKSTGGTFRKDVVPSTIKLTAEMEELSANTHFSFTSTGELGKDNYDGLRLDPLDFKEFLSISTLVGDEQLSINNLPADLNEEVTIPMDVEAFTTAEEGWIPKGGEITLTWPELKNLPEHWEITLTDYKTGITTNVLTESSYTFIAEEAKGKVKPKTMYSMLSPVSVVKSKSTNESSRFGITIAPGTSVGIDDEINAPTEFTLGQNYPNPFNPTTNINYSVGEAGPVNITVYNVMGQKVAELLNTTKNAGSYQVSWNATGVASGIYYYRLTAPGQVLTRQMTLIK
ncbi:MAG: T9SS type A sorting domain-containing protein [Balneola sp.]